MEIQLSSSAHYTLGLAPLQCAIFIHSSEYVSFHVSKLSRLALDPDTWGYTWDCVRLFCMIPSFQKEIPLLTDAEQTICIWKSLVLFALNFILSFWKNLCIFPPFLWLKHTHTHTHTHTHKITVVPLCAQFLHLEECRCRFWVMRGMRRVL